MDKTKIIIIVAIVIIAILAGIICIKNKIHDNIMDGPGMIYEHYIVHLDYLFDSKDDIYFDAVFDYDEVSAKTKVKIYRRDGKNIEKEIDSDLLIKFGALASECQIENWQERTDIIHDDGDNSRITIIYKNLDRYSITREEYPELYKDFFARAKALVIEEIEKIEEE